MQNTNFWSKNLENLKKDTELYKIALDTIFFYNDIVNHVTVDKKGLIHTIGSLLSNRGQMFNSKKIQDTYELWVYTLDIAFCDYKNGFTNKTYNNKNMKEAILANLAEIYEINYADYRGIFYEEISSIVKSKSDKEWYYSFDMCYALIDTSYIIRPSNYDQVINRNLTVLVDGVREFDGFYGLFNKSEEILNNLDVEC